MSKLPRILFAHDFDPAGVMIGWREAIRRDGGEAYVAAAKRYAHRSDFDPSCPDPEVIVVCPGIGDGSMAVDPGPSAVKLLPSWVDELLAKWPKIPRVALFHGSTHCWIYREAYALEWSERGFHLAATTLDYVAEMRQWGCAWLPPLVERAGIAPDHEKGPIIVLQTPTDPVACGTQMFLDGVRRGGGIPLTSWRLPHALNLQLKSRFSIGFDHFRGAPSVNALENAACGQASIFGVSDPVRVAMQNYGIPIPSTAIGCYREALEAKVCEMVARPEMIADMQEECFCWWEDYWAEREILACLEAFFDEVIE